jgi:hypothetical protein
MTANCVTQFSAHPPKQNWVWSRLRVLFGHQSVGQNMLDGLRERQASDAAVPPILVMDGDVAMCGPYLLSARLGQNGSPLSKWQHLEELLARLDVTGIDLVLTKLCYVDVLDAAQVESLFAEYRSRIDMLQTRYPRVLFGHVTVPLRVAPNGLLYALQRPIRGLAPEVGRNAARHAFNERLREAYGGGGLLFDLASIESHGKGGKLVASGYGNARIPALAPCWSDDGGHLNLQGREMVSRAFVEYLRAVEARFVEGGE